MSGNNQLLKYFAEHHIIEGHILGRRNHWRANLVYGFAHLGKSLFWYASELLFAYFLTELVGLTPARMGAVLALGFLVSALIDLLAGFSLRHRLNNARSAGRVQFVGAVLCSITLMTVFADAWLPREWRFSFAVLAGLAFRASYAVFDIPQNSLMALATIDAKGRTHLAATRILFSGIAIVIVATVIGPLVAADDFGGTRLLLGLAILFGAIAILGAGLLWRLFDGAQPKMPAERNERILPQRHIGLPRDFRLLLGLMFATSCFTPVFSKLEPYFAAYGLNSPFWGGSIVIAMATGIFAGQPIWLRVSRRTPPGEMLLWAALLQLSGLLAFWLSGVGQPLLSVMAAFVFGLGNGGAGMILWGAFSEIVARIGPLRTGTSYAMFTAVSKLASAAGILLVSFALARIDFRDARTPELLMLMTVLPGVGAALVLATGTLLRIGRRTG